MTILLYILAIGLMIMAAYVVVLNWGCVIVSIRNQRQGIDKHHSTIPLVSVMLGVFSFLAWPGTPKEWILIIPLVDIGNWVLLCLPIVLIQCLREKKRNVDHDNSEDA